MFSVKITLTAIFCPKSNHTGLALSSTYLKPEFGYTTELEFPLTVGQEYIVYALKEWQGNIWYYIGDDNYTY